MLRVSAHSQTSIDGPPAEQLLVAPASASAAKVSPPPAGNPPPPAISDHELFHVIGRGAYGEVWLARQTRLGTLRAVKVIHRDEFGDARPFEREFEGVRRYEPISRGHPNLVAILHVGGTDECFYYVMELADAVGNPKSEIRNPKEIRNPNAENATAAGKLPTSDLGLRTSDFYVPHTLRSELKHHGAMPIGRCLEIAHALASALAHLHAHSLVHRDVKPSNVIFVGGVAKLADIGLVAGMDEARSFVGTEGYIPPDGPGTPSADCYSLGKLLYELSTGHDRTAWPEPPADLATRPDRERLLELNAILHRACAPDPHQRYANAEAILAEIELLQRGQSVRRSHTWAQRQAVGKKVGLGLLILAVVGALVSIWPRQSRRSEFSSDGPDSTNQQANAFCAKGMYILRGDIFAEFAAAYTNFNKAIELDPNFARPYVGLLELRVPEKSSGVPYATLDDMRTIAQQLKRLAPQLAATYCARSVVDWGEWNFPQAERDGLESIKADPKYAFGHAWYGWVLLCSGRVEEARKLGSNSLVIAPSKVTTYRALGNLHYRERDYTNAITWYRKALDWETNDIVSYEGIADCLRAMGYYTNALEYNEKAETIKGASDATAKHGHDLLRRALDEGGIPGYWTRQWKWAEKKTNSDLYWKAVIQFHLGNTNRALDFLEESYAMREMEGWCPSMGQIFFDHYWDGLHAHPQYKALLDKMGFPKVMSPKK